MGMDFIMILRVGMIPLGRCCSPIFAFVLHLLFFEACVVPLINRVD